MVVSDSLRSLSYGLNLKILLGEHAPKLPYPMCVPPASSISGSASELVVCTDVLKASAEQGPGNEATVLCMI